MIDFERIYRYLMDKYELSELLHKVCMHLIMNSSMNRFIKETGIPFPYTLGILKFINERKLCQDIIKYEYIYIENLRNINKYIKIIKEFRSKHRIKRVYDQWYCSLKTLVKRVYKIISDNELSNKKVLFLGDDDLTSVLLAFITNDIPVEIHVIDIDQELLELIQGIANKYNLSIRTHIADLRDPLPKNLRKKFDIFFTDPPYTYHGVQLFMLQGFLSLKEQKGVRGYVCLSPFYLKRRIYELQQLIYTKGFYIEEIIRSFNVYPIASIHNNITLEHSIKQEVFNYINKVPFLISDLYVLRRAIVVPITNEDFMKVDIRNIYAYDF